MQFLINVLPNDQLTDYNLKLLIENIIHQKSNNVQLIIKREFLNRNLIKFLENAPLNIQLVNRYSEVLMLNNDNYYWINLKDNDCLLPGAIAQWNSILSRHPAAELWLSGLQNERSLNLQIDQLIENANYAKRMTIQHLFYHDTKLNQLSIKQKLAFGLGLQEYDILSDADRFDFLNQASEMDLNHILFHCTSDLLLKLDPSKFNTILHLMLDHQEMLNLKMPTIITSQMSLKSGIEWLKQLLSGTKDIGDAHFLEDYHVYISDQIEKISDEVLNSPLSKAQQQKILNKISDYRHKLPKKFRMKNISKTTMRQLKHSTNKFLLKREAK